MKTFPPESRLRLFALMSSMWLIPGLVGRIFVMRKISLLSPPDTASRTHRNPMGTAVLVIGATMVMIAGTVSTVWAWVLGGGGLVVALVGAKLWIPAGLFTARRVNRGGTHAPHSYTNLA